MDFQYALGLAIDSERVACDMTKKDLAEKLDISVQTLRRTLRGEQDLPLSKLLVIASALDSDPGYLMGRAAEIENRATARAGTRMAAGRRSVQVGGNLTGSGGNTSEVDEGGVNVAGTVFGDVKVVMPNEDDD